MCKMKLGSGGFKHFDEMGYNTSCPVSSEPLHHCDFDDVIMTKLVIIEDSCKAAAVPDPHHFYVVGDDRSFVSCYKLTFDL